MSNMENNLYLRLFKNLVNIYKDNREVGIMFAPKSKEENSFYYSFYSKIDDVEMEEDRIFLQLEDGRGEMAVYLNNEIKNATVREYVKKDVFIVEVGELIITIDTENDGN